MEELNKRYQREMDPEGGPRIEDDNREGQNN